MDKTITFKIDGVDVKGCPGQTIMEAADKAGVYIPRLCYMKDLTPHGSCRVCTVKVDGRAQAACTQPIAEGVEVENNTDELNEKRRNIIDMFFVEGNHFCMFCEKSGNCELQAVAYRLGICAPKYPFQFPDRSLDATHPDIFIDRNRCILCGRCVNASRDVDGKSVFEFVGRGANKKIAVNSDTLAGTNMSVTDKAANVCPVGAIIKKRVGFAVPIGKRLYDTQPIGSDIEVTKS
ncbi:MAG: NADP oxidoreductase [Omnitrophica WOR_2 bacterium GWF2_38_59]|nr:MAG: NADP oxidoreductase [Omnitrophica WOR_2 bacterium GWA2_37_7]OGX22253.1 MAG: NADP oxidoreductase [Omnitrophica WOR_2 bacterium GWF2_38_59]OGX50823.1 MAG: NADP oxidoreductase [Omnitrophica WOR_2 bacterium RIFOXYA2_FULL_38_17]OGX53741.1 MAG: NADP oxidoreductase [Omnitrophica WOR_2 bacterium RIFOXYA12_FULL_38_10]OGX57160.1 MAG: NADP oxidoreductase [Omnitrophica WOR_2 bacterium RIFOXYC2_FULL_38_12]OGX59063.1 MAG: NADP oxidoreductase [Omnitrophica WOR_2 bacterium RIFOXYB2_FULL_38_16]HBG6053